MNLFAEAVLAESRRKVPQPDEEPQDTQLAIYDANPRFTRLADIERAPAEELLRQAATAREGTVADGVSRLLLVAEFDRPGAIEFNTEARRGVAASVTETDPEKRVKQFRHLNDMLSARDGRFRTLFNGRTAEIEGRHYGFALYTPPGQFDFDDRPTAGTWKRDLHFREVPFQVRLEPAGQSQKVTEHRLVVARPPVLLVHGTFDNPHDCWQRSAADNPSAPQHGMSSMEQYLRRKGFVVLLVDYQQSNGAWSAGGRDRSALADNAKVLWGSESNPGIEHALKKFRNELNLAATQVDVVGHSMGGLIARLWASDHYNPGGYRRDDNFQSGDIHRLVTIGTPHHGSDLSEVVATFHEQKASVGIRERLISSIVAEYLKWSQAAALTGAVRDQLPGSEALKRIGPTSVPSHAIVGVASAIDLKDFDGAYQDRLCTLWDVFHKQPRTLKAFLEGRDQSELVDDFHGTIASMAGDEPGWLAEPERLRIKDNAVLMQLFRGAVFGKQQSDMTVRVESQTGGLPLQHTTLIRGVLHSYQPRYEKVQQRVVELLAGGNWLFHGEGFPAAGEPLLNVRPPEFQQDRNERRRAIQAGGMVASQAEAYSAVARRRNEIIIVRPVNYHATPLIAANQATKDMHVKGKSSSWGPQAGYIAVQQRFSKLWFAKQNRDEQIKTYDEEVVKCLADQRASSVELSVTAGGELYDVRVVAGEEDAIRAIVLRHRGSGEFFHWQNDGENFSPESNPTHHPFANATDANTEPMLVLADRFSGLPLTADYDLLGIATPIRGPPAEKPTFDPEMGFVNRQQKELIRQLNYAVRLRANYAGGNVTHHGPETQYPNSPGVDFPLTAFEPSGAIRTIPEGEEGRLDYHVKLYFHQIEQLGWRLQPNPVWLWGKYDPQRFPETGWQPDDHPDDKRRAREEGEVRPPDDPYDSHEGGPRRLALPAPPARLLLPATTP